jgi:hypothetical protein
VSELGPQATGMIAFQKYSASAFPLVEYVFLPVYISFLV